MPQETQLARDARISQLGQIIARHYLGRKERESLRGGVVREALATAAFVLLSYMLTIILLAL